MNFALWFTEIEQQAAMPDPRQFSYIACVLDLMSQNHLEAAARKWMLENVGHDIPPDWSLRAHHMTVLFRQGGLMAQDMETYRNFFGQDVHLNITGIASDDNCVAVTVKPNANFPLQNAIPHITVAHSKQVSPVYSNNLLMDRNKFHHMDTGSLNSVFAAVKRDQKSIWPEKSFPLAVPVKV